MAALISRDAFRGTDDKNGKPGKVYGVFASRRDSMLETASKASFPLDSNCHIVCIKCSEHRTVPSVRVAKGQSSRFMKYEVFCESENVFLQ